MAVRGIETSVESATSFTLERFDMPNK